VAFRASGVFFKLLKRFEFSTYPQQAVSKFFLVRLPDVTAADSVCKGTEGAGALTLNLMDMLCSCLVFDANGVRNFMMFNAAVTSQR